MRLLRGKPPNTPIHFRKEESVLRKRPIKISVRLNEQEHEHLKQQAAVSGLSMEPFIRARIADCNIKPRPPDEMAEINRQLSGIGVNINQIARKVNSSNTVLVSELQEIRTLLTAIWDKLGQL